VYHSLAKLTVLVALIDSVNLHPSPHTEHNFLPPLHTHRTFILHHPLSDLSNEYT
jgi:hypothetical protein